MLRYESQYNAMQGFVDDEWVSLGGVKIKIKILILMFQ